MSTKAFWEKHSGKPKPNVEIKQRDPKSNDFYTRYGVKRTLMERKPAPKEKSYPSVQEMSTRRDEGLNRQFGAFIKTAPDTGGPMLKRGEPQSSFKDKLTQFGKGLASPLITAADTIFDRSLQKSPTYKDPFFRKQYEADKLRTDEKFRPKTTGEKIAAGAGELVGSLVPVGGAYATGGKLAVKAGTKLLPKLLAKPLVKQAVRGAGAGLVYGAGKGLGEGQDLKGIGKEAGINALAFGAADPAFSVLGGVVKRRLIEPLRNSLNSLDAPIFPKAVSFSGISSKDVNKLTPQTILKPLGSNIKSSKNITMPDAPEDIATLYNTKKWYHGTGKADLSKDTLDPLIGSHESLFGQGVYLTDSPKIAKGYAKSRSKRTGTPTTYEAKVNINKVIDLEKPIASDVAKTIEDSAYNDFKDVVRQSSLKPGATPESVIKDLQEAVREHSYAEGYSTNEYVEMFQDLAINLKRAGYDGITHTGGLRTGKDPHRVLIMLDPGDIYAETGRLNQVERFDKFIPKKMPSLNQGLKPKSLQPISTKPEPLKSEPFGKVQHKQSDFQTGPKERQFAQNVLDSQVATGEVKQNLKQNKLTYEPITNKETFDKATNDVSIDPDGALEMFNSPSKGVSANDVALGEALIVKAIKDGNPREANRLIADLAEKLTTAGQAVQAASIFKRLTPEGMLLYAQRIINTANKDALQTMGKKAKKILLTAEDSDFIISTMKKVQELPEGRAKDVELAKVMQLIADKVPATKSEQVKAAQRIALLLNPKTMARNLLGNTIFGTIDNLSNVVATPIDAATSLFTKKRTTTLPSLTGQLKSGLQGAKETLEDASLGIDTYPGRTQFELPSKRIFETKTLNALDKATRVGLQLGDRPFYKAAYDDVLRQQMKLAKVTEPTMEMIEQAHKIAEQRTYQDANALTSAFRQIQNSLNLGKEFGFGNIVLPFVKTPANILKRAIEYSPIGIEKAFREARKAGRGTFDQKAFVDAIARSVTGTALIMVGYDLAKKGIVTGSSDKDKDVAAFERNLGKNDFAFKVDDKYYTYDWAQPASMGLAIGADMYIKGKDRKDAENVISEAIKSGGETLFKQSLLQGLQRFMGGYSPMENIETTAINAPNMLVPTLSKQVAQLTDPLQRSTYSTTKGGTALNSVKSKLPGVSKSLEPKLDTFGNELKNYQGKNNLFNVFLNPGISTEFKPNKVQKEILRLYETTGEKDIFPKVAPKYFTVKGERIDLTPKEITTFQRTMGKETEKMMGEIVATTYPDDVKAKFLARIIEQSYEKAKIEALKKRGKK